MRRGPASMVLATVLMTIMITSAKIAREEMSALEIMIWRAVISLPLAALFARRHGLVVRNRAVMVARCILGFGAMTCYFTATKGLALADLSIISKLQPILVALAAPWILGRGERPASGVWAAVLVGFMGTALLLGPQLEIGASAGLLALGATVLSGGAHLTVRALGRTEPPATIVFWFQVAILILSLGGLQLTDGSGLPWPPRELWPWLLLCGVTATLGQLAMTYAYRVDRAPTVAAAAYTAPLFGVIADLVAFGRWPTPNAWLGGLLVVGAGLWLVTGGVKRSATATIAKCPESR